MIVGGDVDPSTKACPHPGDVLGNGCQPVTGGAQVLFRIVQLTLRRKTLSVQLALPVHTALVVTDITLRQFVFGDFLTVLGLQGSNGLACRLQLGLCAMLSDPEGFFI